MAMTTGDNVSRELELKLSIDYKVLPFAYAYVQQS